MKFYLPFLLLFCVTGYAQELSLDASILEEWSDTQELSEYFKSYQVIQLDKQELLSAWPGDEQAELNLNIQNFPKLKLSLNVNEELISALEFNRTVLPLVGRTQQSQLVSGLLTETTFQLTIGLRNNRWVIEPLSRFINHVDDDLFISYYASDFIEGSEKTCATGDADKKEEELNINTNNKRVDQCYIVEIAIANDYSMYQEYGSVAGVEDHNIAVMNDVQANYRHEFDDNVEFDIVTQFVPTSSGQDPFSSQTGASALLSEFRSWGNAGGFGAVTYDVASLWTRRDLDGSTVGIAYVGVLCRSFRYNVLSDYTSSSETKRVLTAHEIGHNFDADHDASGTNAIMAPSVTITNNWSSTSINSISNHVSSRTCLASCSTEGSPDASFITRSGNAGCSGSTIEMKDFSELGATRSWTLPGSNLGTSNAQQPDPTYNSTGTYDVTVSSTNGAGNNSTTFIDAISIQAAPSINGCSLSGTPNGGGITQFTLANVSNSTGGSDGTASGRQEDFTCNSTVELEANTSYTITVGMGDCSDINNRIFERFQLYIDYNNDQTFQASELVAQTNSFWCGTISVGNDSGLEFTTPGTIAEDVLYMVRAVVDNSTPGSCPNLSTGQVEDYSGFTASAAVLPVEILKFNVIRKEGQVNLEWITSTESNNDGWEIERSLDGEAFEYVGYVAGSVNSTVEQRYEFIDLYPYAAKSYYRLKQIDLDGTESYSPILDVPAIDISYGKLNVYPNPVRSEFSITHLGQLDELSNILVINSLGQVVHNYKLDNNYNKINQTFQWNTGLTTGIYQIIAVQNNSQTLLSKIVYE